ncbi:hypothetical protein FIBSPDRAFT_1047238 [Athelia psychrophila]|uniref:ER transporter 6TM N-terminal domain-containing protein n=1 Tax=Athelia psychrophila TaxID=1759441 RepID=A0A166FG11_9AGAM|nr:hypothetical protein FIBSPDRAFT_1047238 [Fibularhizoctonia sp. CBS 109695]
MDNPQGHPLEERLTRTSSGPLPRRKSHLEVRIADDDSARGINESSSSGDVVKEDGVDVEGKKHTERHSTLKKQLDNVRSSVAPHFAWIAPNNKWSKWKPVIRCALTAWICGVLFLIPATENAMGQASFLVLIASFLSPPSDPFMAVLERETMILLFVCFAWGWSCIGIAFANMARTQHVPTATLANILTGQYIEASPTVILAIFIFFGTAFFLYIKARQGPGPFLFATVFGCICLDITLTTSGLFPYPNYLLGQVIAVPLAIHSAVALVLSILVFPSTISALFTTRLQSSIGPLVTSMELHRTLLQTPVDSPDFTPKGILAAVNQAEDSLVQLAAAARLLKMDIIFDRFSPGDFSELHKLTRRLVVRSNGMTVYFSLIDPTRERFPVTPAPSRPQSPMWTPSTSRPPSPERGSRQEHPPASPDEDPPKSSVSSLHRRKLHHLHIPGSRVQHRHSNHHHNSPSTHRNLLHSSLLHLAISRNPEHAVGVFESTRYLGLESKIMSHPDAERLSADSTKLLDESADELLGGCIDSLKEVHAWMGQLRHGRWGFWIGKVNKKRLQEEKIQKFEDTKAALEDMLTRFRQDKRHKVLEPYMAAFDPESDSHSELTEVPPHRYLFNCYVYQFHLMQFAIVMVDMLAEVIRLERLREKNKLWTPAEPIRNLLSWGAWEPAEHMDQYDEEDPDMIQGVEPELLNDLGMAHRRDPDALPPRNQFEAFMNFLYKIMLTLGGGNTLFALKAALLTVILCIPSFLKSSGSFAYHNKFVWGVFMGQLTMARFRGDTSFGFVARISSTFFGGLVGLIMWYISAGNGDGNPYGLAAVFAVCFPFFFFARIYWPGPPMTNLIFFVTSALVVGYSYQDNHLVTASSPGSGFSVFWRRFVLVTVGVFGAFIFSFLPPSTTLRYYQRASLATSSAELGVIYCAIVSHANSSTRGDDKIQLIVKSLIGIRSKLKRSLVLRTNIIYEFSLRGRWPAERYHEILKIQLEAAFLLSHLLLIVERLEPAWSRAFLRRTRLLEADFQGDVLAVITMISNSLRSGQPLPQITPCPLLDRYMIKHHGLQVIHQDADDEDYGIPRTLTMETLKSEQYLMFSVGVATTFAIVTRLDRLMVATKNLVGEQYHIHGVGLWDKHKGVELGSRTTSLMP